MSRPVSYCAQCLFGEDRSVPLVNGECPRCVIEGDTRRIRPSWRAAQPSPAIPPPLTSESHWSVSVERDGENVVTIESNCLSGRDLSEQDRATIRHCAAHLLAFVGSGEPSTFLVDDDEGPALPPPGNEPSELFCNCLSPDDEHVCDLPWQHKGDHVANYGAAGTRSWSLRIIERRAVPLPSGVPSFPTTPTHRRASPAKETGAAQVIVPHMDRIV